MEDLLQRQGSRIAVMFYVDHVFDFVNKQKQSLEIALQIIGTLNMSMPKPSSLTKMFF